MVLNYVGSSSNLFEYCLFRKPIRLADSSDTLCGQLSYRVETLCSLPIMQKLFKEFYIFCNLMHNFSVGR